MTAAELPRGVDYTLAEIKDGQKPGTPRASYRRR